jgi:hypothetical protein
MLLQEAATLRDTGRIAHVALLRLFLLVTLDVTATTWLL